LLHPTETGTVRLRNNNPLDLPIIEYEWYNEDDFERLYELKLIAENIMS
jgi:hypothetical protein